MEPYALESLWMVIFGFIVAFVLAFGIGANDVANSFGTSVGSGVLTLRQACILASVCEILGAVLIGYKVSDTMRKGILDVSLYEGYEQELMLGCVAALASSAVWLLVATFFKLPISGTHSIVGSTVGFSLVARGTQGLIWSKLGTIVVSWFISPVLSGCVSILIYLLIRKFILHADQPLKSGFRALPIFYGLTFFINSISIIMDGPKLLYMDNIPPWIAVLVSIGLGVVVALITQFAIVPMQKHKIAKQFNSHDKVKFHFAASTESSPYGSPKKNRRPLSIVSESKQLPTIAEITELVSLTGTDSPNISKSTKQGAVTTESYKINPALIKKAEKLLGHTSLDNTDLTITSLKYIDEQQQNNNNMATTTNAYNFNGAKNLQDCFKSPAALSNNKNLDLTNYLFTAQSSSLNKNTDINIDVDHDTNNIYNACETNNNQQQQQNDNNNKDMQDERLMVVNYPTTLSLNSSKIPLIESKETITDCKSFNVALNYEDTEEISMLFSFLQILTATFGSFAHGGNDVSNAIGPLIALYMIYREGSVLQKAESPIALLIYGGIGISIGLWLWGRRVIETIGNDLTKITSSTGFTIEIGAAITVLLASKIGLPISTTHCKVGSVVFVGHISAAGRPNLTNTTTHITSTSTATTAMDDKHDMANKEEDTIISSIVGTATATSLENTVDAPRKGSVDWHLFRNIAYAWIVTVPVTALLGAAFMFVLCSIVLP